MLFSKESASVSGSGPFLKSYSASSSPLLVDLLCGLFTDFCLSECPHLRIICFLKAINLYDLLFALCVCYLIIKVGYFLLHNMVHARVCKIFLLGPVYWQGCTNRPNHLRKTFSV
jgi:hypothetical protein